MTLNNSTTLCSNLRGSTAFGFESVLLVFLGLLALVLNVIHLKVLFNCGGHLPLNTKVLLINCNIASLGKCVTYLFYYPLYNFILLTVGFGSLSLSRTNCVLVAIPSGLCVYALPVGMFFIGCERLYSTCNKNLIQVERVTFSLVLSLLAVWISAAAIFVGAVLIDGHVTAKTVCYCHLSMIMGPGGGTLTNVVQIGMQLTNVLLYAFIFWKNKRNVFDFTLNTARYSLIERFVMWTNIKATWMLLPTTLLHAFTNSASTVVYRMLREVFHYTISDGYLCAVLGVICVMTLDASAQPILCIRFSQQLSEIAAQLFPKFSCIFMKSSERRKRRQVTGMRRKRGYAVFCVSNSVCDIIQEDYQPPPSKPNAQRSLFVHSVIEYRIKPEQNDDILNEMWSKDRKMNKHVNRFH